MLNLWVALLLLSFAHAIFSDPNSIHDASTYSEDLHFYPMEGGKVLAHFEFTHRHPIDPNGFKHSSTFPRAIYETVKDNAIAQMILRFTKGRWDHQQWGMAPFDLGSEGIQLQAWLSDSYSTDENNDLMNRWRGLTHLLAGLFCGSTNLMGEAAKTSSPSLQTPRRSPSNVMREGAWKLLYAALPRDPICTENLTPWLKMLPCQSSAGLAMLVNPMRIFAAAFATIEVEAEQICLDVECHQKAVLLKQRLAVVFNKSNNIPITHNNSSNKRSEQEESEEGSGWSFDSLFGRTMKQACPVADGDRLRVAIHLPKDVSVSPLTKPTSESNGIVEYRGKERLVGANIGLARMAFHMASVLEPSPLIVERHFAEIDKLYGHIHVSWTNHHPEQAMQVRHLEQLPWFLRLYMHTMQFRLDVEGQSLVESYKPSKLIYLPAISRERPSQIEMDLIIPPGGSILSMSMMFEKPLLRYTEYPSDPNRGFDICGALIQWHLLNSDDSANPVLYHQISTPTALVLLPTPDFTMPYNVIMLTSTLMALAYGMTFNQMFRRFHLPGPEREVPPLKRAVRFLFVGLWQWLRHKMRPHAHSD